MTKESEIRYFVDGFSEKQSGILMIPDCPINTECTAITLQFLQALQAP